MKKRLLAATMLMLLPGLLHAQTAPSGSAVSEPALTISRQGSRSPVPGPPENFTGAVRIERLFTATESARASGSYVTFSPGAHTAWHTHPLGQTLIVTAGVGRVQRWGGPVEEIRPGDVVRTPPGVKHWHGAAPDSSMTHLTVQEQQGGKAIDWLEKVSNEQYLAAASPATPESNAASPPSRAQQGGAPAPLLVQEQGSFAVGGTVIRNAGTFDPLKPSPEGQTYHGDHAYVFYQVPVNARRLPLVLWHGAGQSSKTWETTPDGREGYQNIFLRRGFSVYLIDQPRRGKAGRSTVPIALTAGADEQQWFNQFRLGVWPSFFPGAQFSRDPQALDQYFRQMTPNTGPFDVEVTSNATADLFKRIGPGVLVTHSQAGGPGWATAMKTPNVRAVVAYEPGSGFVFPQDEVPPPMPSSSGSLEAAGVPLTEFMKLTRIPIIVFYGDNIPEKPTANPGQDSWRVRLEMARLWRDALNRRGGDVTVVHLPEVGIRGNTHFPFSDLNNREIADLLSDFLKTKHLDQSSDSFRENAHAKAQTRKQQPGGLGSRARLHGHELRLRPGFG